MKQVNWITGSILAFGASVWAMSANAAFISKCDATALCAADDVTFESSVANDAALFSGNDGGSATEINATPPGWAPDDFSYLDKTDAGSALFEGVTFTLEASQSPSGDCSGGTTSCGTWTLSWEDTVPTGDLPLTMDFVFVTKGATTWAAYLFEGYTFDTDPTTGNGTFEINYVNNGGNNPDLSHASIYGRLGADDPDPPQMPVPGTVLLMGLGLGLLRFAKGKRS